VGMARTGVGFPGAAGRFAAQGEFAGNVFCGLRGDANELDANANTGQAVANFAARAHFDIGDGEAEAEIQYGALGERATGADEHASGA